MLRHLPAGPAHAFEAALGVEEGGVDIPRVVVGLATGLEHPDARRTDAPGLQANRNPHASPKLAGQMLLAEKPLAALSPRSLGRCLLLGPGRWLRLWASSPALLLGPGLASCLLPGVGDNPLLPKPKLLHLRDVAIAQELEHLDLPSSCPLRRSPGRGTAVAMRGSLHDVEG